jgi:V8-like Glu-specific endopeptidase
MSQVVQSLKTLGAFAVLVSACAVDDPEGASDNGLVYGADDRRDWYEVGDATARARAASTAAVLRSTSLTLRTDGRYQIATGTTLASSQGVCSTEPYRTQPTPAFCTAFLVAPDLVATAGHCITGNSSCSSARFVFDFRMESATTVRSVVEAADVYRCAAIVGRAETSTDDWGVIRLDRPVTGRTPLALRRTGTVALGTALTVIGHPSGLPIKIADGATVRNATHANYFEVNVDTYGGNSGSPVFNNNTGEVEGILVRGNTDYVDNSSLRCYVSNQCPDTGSPGGLGWDDITRTSRFTALVPVAQDCSANGVCNTACAAGTDPDCPPSPTTETSCTNGVVDDGDTRIECADGDCTSNPACVSPTMCGNGTCEVGESCDGRLGTRACASDCAGRTGGNPSRRYCFVNGVCRGSGCP